MNSKCVGGSPGLVVTGGDSFSKGREFESWNRTLDGHFFTYLFVVKFVMCVWKDENKWKRGWGWAIFIKKCVGSLRNRELLLAGGRVYEHWRPHNSHSGGSGGLRRDSNQRSERKDQKTCNKLLHDEMNINGGWLFTIPGCLLQNFWRLKTWRRSATQSSSWPYSVPSSMSGKCGNIF